MGEALEQARERMGSEARDRKARHDKNASSADIPVGGRVLVRNREVRGRNKCQDAWSALPYKVVGRPDPLGSVYVVTPTVGSGPDRTLNRVDLYDLSHRPEVCQDPPVSIPPVAQPGQELGDTTDDESSDDELLATVALRLQANEPSAAPGPSVPKEPVGLDPSPPPSVGDDGFDVGSLGQGDILEPVTRRGRRSGAGRHSNPFKLPRGFSNQ